MYEREFYDILNQGERILWADKPHRTIHLLKGVPMLIFGLLWGAFDFFFIMMARGTGMMFFMVPFMLIHMAPLWIGVGGMIALLASYRNTIFCYTDKRVIIRGGFWGIDYKSIDFDAIAAIEVNVNPIENNLGVGTIRINEDYIHTGKRSVRTGKRLYGIDKPYEVYKELKKVALDIRSDISYPNQLRPEGNPGYNTEYKD